MTKTMERLNRTVSEAAETMENGNIGDAIEKITGTRNCLHAAYIALAIVSVSPRLRATLVGALERRI